MSTIQIQVFAVLKGYFKPEFELNLSDPTVEGLKNELERLNPASKKILQSCRFAVNENFVSQEYTIQEHDRIAVIPPSSGG